MNKSNTGAAELPEALRLAACFDDNTSVVGAKRIAAELRRLHAENEALRAQPAGAATPAKPSPHADADEIALFDEYMRGCREYNIEPDLGTAFHAGRKSARGAATPAAPSDRTVSHKAQAIPGVQWQCGPQATAFGGCPSCGKKDCVAMACTRNITKPKPQPAVTAGAVDALDAARYRVVRRGQHWSVIDGIGDPLMGDALDMAIDAALAAQREVKP
jgi:hypothetical protein